jgi:hypothetical protein
MTALEFLTQLDTLLDDDAYAWAFETLSDIRASISKNADVTPGRVQAIENIKRAVSDQQRAAITGASLPSDKYKTSRRYEGYEGERKGRKR